MLFHSLIFLCIGMYISTPVSINGHLKDRLEEIQNELQNLMDNKVPLENATMRTVEIPSSNKENCSRYSLKIYIQHLKSLTPANGDWAKSYHNMLENLEIFSNALSQTGQLPQNEQQNCKTSAVKTEDLLQRLKEFLQNVTHYLKKRQ